MKLKGRIAVVTGAARGIGRAIARLLVEEGAQVALLDLDGAGLRVLESELGSSAAAYPLDIGEAGAVQEVFEQIRHGWGRVGILVNNAGYGGPFQTLVDLSLETWNRVLQTNLTGTFLCTRAAIPDMVELGGGHIVNIASHQGLVGAPLSSAYVASKHAVVGLTRTTALEWGRQGIRANALCPGYVDTAMGVQKPGQLEEILSRSVVERLTTPEEIARVVLFLLSDAPDALTGAALAIDGGLTAGWPGPGAESTD